MTQQHTHTYMGQKLVHSHEGGDRNHGYFEHPEDGYPYPTEPVSAEAHVNMVAEYRKALAEAYALLQDARPEYVDPALRRSWGRKRRQWMDRMIGWGVAS